MPTAEVALRIRILKADAADDTLIRDLLLARAMRSSEVCGRTPIIVLLLAAASDGDATPRPSALPARARTLRTRARTDLGRAFLKAAEVAAYAVPTVYRRGRAREWLDATAFDRLPAADRTAWSEPADRNRPDEGR